MVIKKWELLLSDKKTASKIASEYQLDGFLALLLSVRKMSDYNTIIRFFSNKLYLNDPFLLKDMDKAVKRIQKAIDSNEKICIYGDYDADGITACVLLYEYLEMRGADVLYYIPNRFNEGYGLNNSAVEYLSNNGVQLIITVDNGIVAFEQIKLADSLNIDVIVTDHHRQKEKLLPVAKAIVNPHRYDCESPFKEFSGVGVAFNLVLALEEDESLYNELFDTFFDLVCIGTVADIVSLTDDNRDLVKFGLEKFAECERPGINALLTKAGVKKENITARDIGFKIAPRINAAGRLNYTQKAVELLLCKDEEKAVSLAEELDEFNTQRKNTEDEILKKIEDKIEKNPEILSKNRVIIVWDENLHTGVIGIAASRITAKYGKPAIIISVDKEKNTATGSGRSIDGFSLYDTVSSAAHLLEKFGGHKMAVGFSLKYKDLDEFEKTINNYARENYSIMPPVKIKIDCKINPTALNKSFADNIKCLEPFGVNNEKPLIGIFNLTLLKIIPLSGGKHLKLIFSRNNTKIEALYFFCTAEKFGCKTGDILDIAVNLEISEYQGKSGMSVIIKEIKFSKLDYDNILMEKSLYFKFINKENTGNIDFSCYIPSREDFVFLYRYLKSCSCENKRADSILFDLKKQNIGYFKFNIILNAMCELNLIDFHEKTDEYTIAVNKISEKVNLENSQTLLYIKKFK